MTKTTTPTPQLLDFHRPHNRSDTWTTNEYVDPITGEIIDPPSMTKQSFVDECDINNILKQYKKTGMIQHVSAQAATGRYMDLPSEVDFQTSLNIVIQSEEAFATLPSKLRARFGNDPEEFLAFMSDPRNQDEAITLGLATDTRPAPAEPPASEASAPQPPPPPGK